MSEIYRAGVDPAATNNPHSYALQMVGNGYRVLEVGCSVGHVTEQLVAAGNTVVGVEIDPAGAAEARRWAERVHVRDLDIAPLSEVEPGPFDVLLLGDVLEHFRDPNVVLRDLVSLLADDGRVVLSVPHVGFADLRLMLLEGTWAYQDRGILDRTHLRWFTKATIRDLLADAGLVATRLERVRKPIGGTLAPVTLGVHAPDVIRFVEADPEALTFQFVVEARRGAPTDHDPLAPDTVAWPDVAAERAAADRELAELRERVAALESEVDAWRRSRLARAAAPIRAMRARLARRGGV